jgi:hypothetical protein
MTTERSPSSPRHFDAPATAKLTPTTSLRTAGHAVDPIIHSVAGANRDAIPCATADRPGENVAERVRWAKPGRDVRYTVGDPWWSSSGAVQPCGRESLGLAVRWS